MVVRGDETWTLDTHTATMLLQSIIHSTVYVDLLKGTEPSRTHLPVRFNYVPDHFCEMNLPSAFLSLTRTELSVIYYYK